MASVTVTLGQTERIEGTSKKTGNPFVKFVVHSDGGEFSTFDAALADKAFRAPGARATIEYETSKFGNDLKGLVVDPASPVQAQTVAPTPQAAPAAPAPRPNGDPDWDLIGLRKTRCALWAGLFAGGTLAGMPETAALVMGVALVRGAEADIFNRDPAEAPGDFDAVPF